MINVSFELGASRHGEHAVNYMITSDSSLYAETSIPVGASEDYGYFALKDAIIRQAREQGIRADDLEFFYDGQENFLDPDAKAACEIKGW